MANVPEIKTSLDNNNKIEEDSYLDSSDKRRLLNMHRKIEPKKPVGQQILDDKRSYKIFRNNNIKEFNKTLLLLNKTLNSSEILLKSNHFTDKFDINTALSIEQKNIIKKLNYEKKWNFSLPAIKNNNKINNKNISKKIINNIQNFKQKQLNGCKSMPDLNQSKIKNQDSIRFRQPQKAIQMKEIVKRYINGFYNKNKFDKYCYELKDKVGNYVQHKDRYDSYYDFDKQIQKDIKDEKIGLAFPGNIINRQKVGYLYSLHPKYIKEKGTKIIHVPDRTILPVPRSSSIDFWYTRITMNDIYNEKNKMV